MENFESVRDDADIVPSENPRAPLRAAEAGEEREKIERQMLLREYRQVQMELIELRGNRDKGIEKIRIAVDKEDPQAEAFRNSLIELGRRVTGEIEALEMKKAELKEKIEAMGGTVDNDTVH